MYNTYEKLFGERFPFWNDLSEENRNAIISHTGTIRYSKGENIHDGNECTGAIIVKSGCLRIYILSDEGKEITLYRLYEGDFCMLSASCVLQSITFDVMIDSEEDSECCIIDSSVFGTAADSCPKMKIFMLETALGRFSEVMWAMQQILFMSFDKRLAIFLLDESAKTGSDTVKLTHEQIAKYIGSAREVVSRMLKYFSSENLVELSRGEVKITDKKRLRNLIL